MTFRRAADVQIPFPSFHDHRATDEVVDRCQLEVVFITGHCHSIMNDWPVFVMMMRNIFRNEIASVIYLLRYYDLVIMQVFLQSVHP